MQELLLKCERGEARSCDLLARCQKAEEASLEASAQARHAPSGLISGLKLLVYEALSFRRATPLQVSY